MLNRGSIHDLSKRYFDELEKHLDVCEDEYSETFSLYERLEALKWISDILADQIIDHEY